ncbi:MAG: methyltransferase domain-containing protein [Candidatus Hydrogenedentota bacterium]|nr:MAG: methyltransferase domain-containing protein [Candidatus Hydrogenedentota bacterium]
MLFLSEAMNSFSTDSYWRSVHRETVDDLAAVNYPSLPAGFNRLVDRIFREAIEEVLRELPSGRAFEIGCGRGRWMRLLRGRGWVAHGCDIALSARPSVVASELAVPIRSRSCNLVLAITVLQHIREKEFVLDEIFRILEPGGHVLLVEILERPGGHLAGAYVS